MSSRGPLAPCVVALFAASVFAGCISDDGGKPAVGEEDLFAGLTEPIYEAIEKLHVQVPGHDGKLQDTWVFKPQTDDPDARFPVFINFSPYWYNLAPSAETGGDAFSQHMIDYFVPRGYAIVLASVRGTGHSEGCFPIGGIKELEDAYAVIDHFANVEWSNGNVGSGGKSYDGTTIQGVAGYKPHPALKIIFPVSGISDLYRYNYRGGVPYGQGPIFNTYYYAGVGINQYGDPADQSPYALADDVACTDLPFVQGHGVATGVHGLYNDYWNERNYIRYAPNVEAALFYVHGFQDWNVKPDHILPWLTELPEGAVVKAYLHQWVEDRTGHVYPMRDDWNHTMHRVMDHYLLGIDTGLGNEPAFHVQDSSGQWRTEETWPPANAMPTAFYPHADNTLGDAAGTGIGGAYPSGQDPQPFEWSVTLNETLHYAGVPVLKARLSTTDPYTPWVAQLWKEENGERVWMNEGVLRAYLRDSMEMPSPVAPGQFYDYTIEFYPQDDVFPAGSKLILTFGTGGARHVVTTPEPAQIQVDRASTMLELPVIDQAAVTWEAPQPVEIACFAC